MAPAKTTELYLVYDESTHGGGIEPGQEDQSWPSYEDEHIDFYPRKAYLKRDLVPDWRVETFDALGSFKPGGGVHLVIVRYSDGGTFQTTRGYWKIYGAFKDLAKAVEVCNLIQLDTSSRYEDREPKYGPAPWAGKPGVLEDYRCWDHYFAGFESVDVHSVVVF